MNDPGSVTARSVVVTGATSGIGLATARLLAAAPGVTVVVAARDAARGAGVAAELEAIAARSHAASAEASTAPAAVALSLDLADLASIRAFPDALDAARLPPLHALIANAGIQYTDRTHATPDGFEATFATNHLGHFLLIRLLLDRLAGDDARIAIVSSGTHKPQRRRNGGFPRPRWADARTLATPGEGSGQVAYSTSKLANAITAVELGRRIDMLRPGARIAVHGVDPGLVPATGLARDYSPRAQRAYRAVAPLLARLPGATTPERAAANLAATALDPSYARGARPGALPAGRWWEVTKDGEPSALAQDPQVGAALWRDSEVLVGLATAPQPAT